MDIIVYMCLWALGGSTVFTQRLDNRNPFITTKPLFQQERARPTLAGDKHRIPGSNSLTSPVKQPLSKANQGVGPVNPPAPPPPPPLPPSQPIAPLIQPATLQNDLSKFKFRIPIVNDPVQGSKDAGQIPNDPVNKPLNTGMGPNDPVNKPLNTGMGPNDPVNKPLNTGIGPNDPVNKPLNTGIGPNDPVNKPLDKGPGPNAPLNSPLDKGPGSKVPLNSPLDKGSGPKVPARISPDKESVPKDPVSKPHDTQTGPKDTVNEPANPTESGPKDAQIPVPPAVAEKCPEYSSSYRRDRLILLYQEDRCEMEVRLRRQRRSRGGETMYVRFRKHKQSKQNRQRTSSTQSPKQKVVCEEFPVTEVAGIKSIITRPDKCKLELSVELVPMPTGRHSKNQRNRKRFYRRPKATPREITPTNAV